MPDEDNQHVQQPTTLARVSVKIPPFWSAKPQLWFAQVESQFFAGGITRDETKYHTVVAAIESNILNHVSDIILNPPTADMYSTLKKRMIEQFADSEQKQIRKLLQDMDLGDIRPSQLLREMRELAGKNLSDEILKSIWLQRLPPNIRSILAISNEKLPELALLADKIIEVNDQSQISACSTSAPNTTQIEEVLANLTRQIDELKTSFKQNGRQRTRSRHGNSSNTRGRSKSRGTDSGICWYHTKFKKDAQKCRPPCKFSSEN